jgi:diguanylate cyclase (GGDEF)-like protein
VPWTRVQRAVKFEPALLNESGATGLNPPEAEVAPLLANDNAPVANDNAPVANDNPPAAEPSGADTSPLLPEPEDWTDPFTGADGPLLWNRLVRKEEARMRRYRRTACIVLVEFAGLEDVSSWLGRELAVELFARLSRALAAEIRTSDEICRISRDRFGILLVETDEVAAINFVDRVRPMLRKHIGSKDIGLRVRIGWASPPDGAGLTDAITIAEKRLATDPNA